jgi:hypothetical protein
MEIFVEFRGGYAKFVKRIGGMPMHQGLRGRRSAEWAEFCMNAVFDLSKLCV